MVNINRHNYEEYFMLYLDNELNADESKAVEAFVAQHPDLKAELEMLQNVQLSPEQILFSHKDILHKKETKGINNSNYSSYFLLSVDNELNEKEKAQVEKFVLQNPALQEEFLLLQKTKLPVETVVFPDKDSLYRNEKERRIVPLIWMRMSVAAAVIGLMATLWFLVPGNEKLSGGSEVVTTSTLDNNSPKQNNQLKTTAQINDDKTTDAATTGAETQPSNAVNNKVVAVSQQKNKINSTAKTTEIISAEKIDKGNLNNLPSPVNIARLQNNKVNQIISSPIEVNKNEVDKLNNNSITVVKNNSSSEVAIVKPAIYKEMEMEDENDNGILIGSANINKEKLKGIFKKAINFLDIKKPKFENDDNQIQIASFTIKTK